MLKRIAPLRIFAIVLAAVALVAAPAHATPIVEFTFDSVQPGARTPMFVRPEITPFPGASFFAMLRLAS